MAEARDFRKLKLAAVILAAGLSSRMGKPKLLLPWRTTTVLGHLIAQWRSLSTQQTAVVCAENDNAIQQEASRLKYPARDLVFNPTPERGMFSSIQCAARWGGWENELTHWAIVLGDQPHLREETLGALLNFAAAHPRQVCQPGRRGRPRHPVVLPKNVFEQLRSSRAETLKDFLQTLSPVAALCELDDPGLDFDMDTPADYERALRLCFGASS